MAAVLTGSARQDRAKGRGTGPEVEEPREEEQATCQPKLLSAPCCDAKAHWPRIPSCCWGLKFQWKEGFLFLQCIILTVNLIGLRSFKEISKAHLWDCPPERIN
jgi:hypothetical protein